jgi:hypothetical protein
MKLTVFALLLVALAFGTLTAIFRSGFQKFDEPGRIIQGASALPPLSSNGQKRLQPWLREKSIADASQIEDPMAQAQPVDPPVDEQTLKAWSEDLRLREEALLAAEEEQRQWVDEQQQALAEQQQWVEDQQADLAEEHQAVEMELPPVNNVEAQDYVPTPEEQQAQYDAERALQLEEENAWLLERQRQQQDVVYVPYDPNAPPVQSLPPQPPAAFPSSGRLPAPISRMGQPVPRASQPIPRKAAPIKRTGRPIPRQSQPIRRVPQPQPQRGTSDASGAPEDLIALTTELPEAMFEGIKFHSPKIPNLEPIEKKQAALMVPRGLRLLSNEKSVITSDHLPVIGDLEYFTDGDKDAVDGSYMELGPGLQWVQIDLEQEAEIHGVWFWHFHKSARAYIDVIVQISNDVHFADGNEVTIYNADHDNSSGLGAGSDKMYFGTHRGRVFNAYATKGRYVRFHSNGNTSNEMNHYIEAEVWGKRSSLAASL